VRTHTFWLVFISSIERIKCEYFPEFQFRLSSIVLCKFSIFRLNEEMGEIALELERIGFRTPTVFQTAWTPARDKFGTDAKHRKAGGDASTETSKTTDASSAQLPDERSVQTPREKVERYLGRWATWFEAIQS
jgi:hypothetical protein